MSGSKKVFTTLGSSNHVPEEREAFDYYATDPKAVTASGMNFPVMNVFTDRMAPMICFTRQIVRRMQNNENYQA